MIYTLYCCDGRNAQKVKAALPKGIGFVKDKNDTVIWVECDNSLDWMCEWAKQHDIVVARVEGGRDAI